ncbi:WXG100 family type VII secretion target [Nocardia amikacinitolerans]|uniref:WXG100 family type VII secretion target n=1 Tax=Nocardia amikacinitolerans TaxID=756689 RepID=UPI0036CFEE79
MSTVYPIEKLTEPKETDPIPDLAELIINGNGVSMTYIANTIIKTFTGYDILGTITNKYTGDWAALQKAADAVRNLADYNTEYHKAIDSAMSKVDQSWAGNAADSARSFFTTLTDALDNQVDPLHALAETIDNVANIAYANANALAAIVQTLGDLVIAWIVNQAAKAAAASSVVGAPYAAALVSVDAAITAFVGLETVKFIGILGNVISAIQGLSGVIAEGTLAVTDSVQIPDLPGDSYDHPGVTS